MYSVMKAFCFFIEARLKRKEPPSFRGRPAKQQQLDVSHKDKIRRLAKMFSIAAPVYDTVRSSDGLFSSTIEYDGNSFQSLGHIRNREDAEQSAAHVALYVLGEEQEFPKGFNS